MHEFQAKNQKKSVRIRPIRPIRFSIVSPCSTEKRVSKNGSANLTKFIEMLINFAFSNLK
jgi:hypothetical protein